ncbi:MAG: FHA domain-containing protein [Burkholderiaceae bacterium]
MTTESDPDLIAPVVAPASPIARTVVPDVPAPLLALIEATERHGAVQARLGVRQWPVTVGRNLHSDLVLDDVHVAAQHLSLSQNRPGSVRVRVLDSTNGASIGPRQHGRGEIFDWSPGEVLSLGRLHLRLRLAESPLPDEQPLPRQAWGSGVSTLACVLLLMLLVFVQAWLKVGETQNLAQDMPVLLVGALGVLFIWSGAWALGTKIFSGNARFWRHVRIACLAFVAGDLLEFAAQVGAFAFSWENLSRFAYLALVFTAALGIYRHLLVAAPHARRGLALVVVAVLLIGLPTMWGTQWLKNRRVSDQLYMAQMFPPSWRIAKPVPVSQFLQEARGIQQRLDARLSDKEVEDATDPGDEEQ